MISLDIFLKMRKYEPNLVLEDTFTGMTADDLADMMNGVDLEDPNQLSVAKGALDAVIGKMIIE